MKKNRSGRLDWLDPVGKPRRIRVRLSLVTAFALLVAGLCFGLMNLWFGTGGYGKELFDFYFTQPYLVLLNELPFVVLILLLWSLTNRAWIAFLSTGIFTLIYSWAEYWKLMGRNDPIVADDLTIIAEGIKMGGSYINITWQIVLSALLVILGTLFCFFFLRGRLPKLLPRLGIAALLIGGFALLYTNVYCDYQLYEEHYDCWSGLNKWIEGDVFLSRGCMYPFLYTIRSSVVHAPEGYQEAEARAILEEYDTDDIPEEKKVNVIVVMYEAFADLSLCTDRITAADPYVSFHKLQSESYHGSLVTNIFAAGTINTERCVLSGFSRLTSFRRPSWSYARYFADQGYAVNGSHPGYQTFYNRVNVNANLGIEGYLFKENYYDAISPNQMAPDAIFLPEIVRICRRDLENSDYVFSYNVTYQNHGPYSDKAQGFAAPYIPAEGLNTESYRIVNNYLAGVEDTGNQMLAMADLLREDDTPWVLVFFGDHKPWLGNQGSVYAELGIDLSSGSEEAFLNYYSTEYLIWANDAAKERLGDKFSGEGPAVSPCYLMNLLFERCGWKGPSFLKLSEELRAKLPVISSSGQYYEDGKLVAGWALSEESKELTRRMFWAQFYLTRDSGGSLPAKNTKLP